MPVCHISCQSRHPVAAIPDKNMNTKKGLPPMICRIILRQAL